MKRWCVLFVSFAVLITGLVENAMGTGAARRISVMHYFSDSLGQEGIRTIFNRFSKEHGVDIADNSVGHESFKNVVLEMAAKGFLPDIFSYWAGARSQFLVDSGAVAPLDTLWKEYRLDDLVPASLAGSATVYNGRHYLIPFGYHCVGFFYNPHVFERAGIKSPPDSWEAFMEVLRILRDKGITPIALGAKNRWPAQFWFDYLLLRTAGPDFRKRLMNGDAPYTDKRVMTVMRTWKTLIDAGFFQQGATIEDWTEAAGRVGSGSAAMTLMGTWITGYWESQGREAIKDYDFFEFPAMDPDISGAVIGPVDGFMVSSGSSSKQDAFRILGYLLTDMAVQKVWAVSQGALSPNLHVDASIYSPVMIKALKAVTESPHFAFNYDLATTPPMAEKGLGMFFHFLNDPEGYADYLESTQKTAQGLFRK